MPVIRTQTAWLGSDHNVTHTSISCTRGGGTLLCVHCRLLPTFPVWSNGFHLPLHTIFDHSKVAISDDFANLVFFTDAWGMRVLVPINCRGETKVINKQVLKLHKTKLKSSSIARLSLPQLAWKKLKSKSKVTDIMLVVISVLYLTQTFCFRLCVLTKTEFWCHLGKLKEDWFSVPPG